MLVSMLKSVCAVFAQLADNFMEKGWGELNLILELSHLLSCARSLASIAWRET